jgi:excisionase family DNA binding protein
LNRLLTIETLAETLAKTPLAIRGLIRRKQIPFIKIGASIRFDPEDVQGWLARNTVRPMKKPLRRRNA